VLAIGKLVPASAAAVLKLIDMLAAVAVKFAAFNVFIFKHLPELAALLNIEVAAVVLRLAPVVFPFIVAAPIKFGAAIFYPPKTKLKPTALALLAPVAIPVN